MPRTILPLAIASFTLLLGTAVAESIEKCTPKTCDAECQNYFNEHEEQITNSWMRVMSASFSRQCGSIARPQERDDCYVENVTHHYGYTPATLDKLMLKRFTNSPENPSVGRCIKAIHEAAYNEQLKQIEAINKETVKRREEQEIQRQKDTDAQNAEHARRDELERLQNLRQMPSTEVKNLMGQSLNSLLQGALNQ